MSMLTATGATTSCFSWNNAGNYDVYLRYGASAIIGKSPPIQAYSVNPTSVSTWDVQGVNTSGAFISSDTTMTWDQANTACSTAGGRLPTVEELYTLSQASYTASGNTSYTPPSFGANDYWSSTTVPSTPANAYHVNMSSSNIYGGGNKTSGFYVRCVR